MTTIVGNRGQLWTSALSPHSLSRLLDFPKLVPTGHCQESWSLPRVAVGRLLAAGSKEVFVVQRGD